jgi:hypothetical protein
MDKSLENRPLNLLNINKTVYYVKKQNLAQREYT